MVLSLLPEHPPVGRREKLLGIGTFFRVKGVPHTHGEHVGTGNLPARLGGQPLQVAYFVLKRFGL
jgi:hypothetical protein